MWTSVELSLGVVSACLPTLRPLVARTFNSRTPTYGVSHESRLGPQDGCIMLNPIDSRAKGSTHKSGFVNKLRPLNRYVSMPSNDELIREQRGATRVGEAITY